MSDDVVGRAREALAKGTHTSAFAVAAAGLVEELADEVDSLRAAGPWTTHVEQMRAMRAERDGDCICDTNPDPETCDGPEETCPYHGRAYAEWVERGDLWQERAEIAEAEAARLRKELDVDAPMRQLRAVSSEIMRDTMQNALAETAATRARIEGVVAEFRNRGWRRPAKVLRRALDSTLPPNQGGKP